MAELLVSYLVGYCEYGPGNLVLMKNQIWDQQLRSVQYRDLATGSKSVGFEPQ